MFSTWTRTFPAPVIVRCSGTDVIEAGRTLGSCRADLCEAIVHDRRSPTNVRPLLYNGRDTSSCQSTSALLDFAAVALPLLVIVSLSMGRYSVDFGHVVGILLSHYGQWSPPGRRPSRASSN